ncbi:MAG: response regulator [Candidatus Electrothrix sp. GW3-4]|uniref:response regulator n=1 Tax=Candidatus Electrothrix sp. GW3-4 TaxID=3126740 RepID=UPI0030CDC7F2
MKYLVVVVDDSKFVHKLIEKLFDSKTFDVHFFTSAEEAKNVLDTFSSQGREVDLVLLDIYLQDGTKEESVALLELLTRERKRTQVIIMSGRLSPNEFAEFYSKGADSYLIKPFSEEKFLSSVKRHVNIARNISEYNNAPLAKIKVEERDIFISHSSANEKLASFLRDEFMKNNIGSSCENAELLADDIWRPILLEAINTCKIFLLILTQDTLRSDYMKQEIIQAFNRKKRDGNSFFIIPVLYNIQPTEVPRQISSMHCVDLTSADKRADQIRSLSFSIKKILSL